MQNSPSSSQSNQNFTAQTRLLLNKIHGNSKQGSSVYEAAEAYFSTIYQVLKRKASLKKQMDTLKAEIANTHDAQLKQRCYAKFALLKEQYTQVIEKQKEERLKRLYTLYSVCDLVIELIQGRNFSECTNRIARLLANIQMLSPISGPRVARTNQRHKHLYKGVIAIALFNEAIRKGYRSNEYIAKVLAGRAEFDPYDLPTLDPEFSQVYKDKLLIPILMAAILQDIGLHHPDAKVILYGEDGQENPFRRLENGDREKLLKISYGECLRYITGGIGMPEYVVDKKIGAEHNEVARAQFEYNEKEKLGFTRLILKSWVNPKDGIGNLLKVPQVYTSIVLATHENFQYALLPKAFAILKKHVELNLCDGKIVNLLHKILGDFPQGYGLPYIPDSKNGAAHEKYELAIVNALYPVEPNTPSCRAATRKMQYVGNGANFKLPPKQNLYFPEAQKQLQYLNNEKIQEIINQLSSDKTGGKNRIPSYWDPANYFNSFENINIWTTKQS